MSPYIYHYYCDFIEFKFQIYSVKTAIREKEKIRNAGFEGDLEIVTEGAENEGNSDAESETGSDPKTAETEKSQSEALDLEKITGDFDMEHGLEG